MKKKPKAKEKPKTLVLDCQKALIPKAVVMQYKFSTVTMLALQIPGAGVIVMGKDKPNFCWSYPPGTEIEAAVSKTIRLILEKACAQWDKGKKHDAC